MPAKICVDERSAKFTPQKKAPQDAGAGSDWALSREERTSAAASEGSLADGNRFADYSGGTAADLHGTSALPTPAN
jgi:hypothetical protein